MTGPFDMTSAGDARNADGCERLDELLPDYLEGALAPADLAFAESHLAGCARCAALVADLGDLRGAAAALPVLAPSHDLWDGISARIAAPVIPLEARHAGAPRAMRRHARWTPAWLGAAAAALVVVTAGVTYQLTVRGTTTVAVADSARPAPRGADTPLPAGAASQPADTIVTGGASTLAAAPRQPARAGGSAVRAVRGAPAPAPAARAFDSEIASLRAILDERRASLSPETVEVLDLNLKIIDQAIAQSRAALAKEPASDFLDRQLDMALEKKLELLRTAALLPAT